MMKLTVCLAAAVVALPVTAHADPLGDAAKCMVKRNRVGTVSIARALPLGRESATVSAADLGDAGSCLKSGSVTAPAAHIRGAVAEALYMNDFREVGMLPKRAPGDFADLGLPDVSSASTSTVPELAEYRLADCVARSNTEDADGLIKTQPGSRVEAIKLARLNQYMAPCAKGATVTVHQPIWRALLTQSAYRGSARYWDNQLAARRVPQAASPND